jgi:putative DNA primase/helicase
MNAAEIAAALGDGRPEGRGWRCRCPLHGGRSLVLRDGVGGRVLVTCWGGCDRLDVLVELRRRGLLDGNTAKYRARLGNKAGQADTSRVTRARAILSETQPGAETIVARYLASRGIDLDAWPSSLRFHPRCPRPRDSAGEAVSRLPAMVGLVEHVEHGPTAVHCTSLRPDGSSKADVEKPKAMFGLVGGGAVRFGTPAVGEWFAVAEGIETALSLTVACSIPAWAALSAGGIKNLILPPEATHVVICADHDLSGTGQRAADLAARRFMAEGRRVRVAKPPKGGTDFNDLLRGGAANQEACHAVTGRS